MIRVIIERHIKDNCFHDYLDIVRRARKKAVAINGFIAGELLQEREKKNVAVIISSWENFQSWNTWLTSKERSEALDEMRPLLTENEKITVLEGSQPLK